MARIRNRARSAPARLARYSLLELIVTLAIVALAAGLAGTRLRDAPPGLRLRTFTDEFASFLSSARGAALRGGCRVEVELDGRSLRILRLAPETGSSAQAGQTLLLRSMEIPKDVEIASQAACDGAPRRLFALFPDGRGGGSPVLLKLKGAVREAGLSPLSGTPYSKELD